MKVGGFAGGRTLAGREMSGTSNRARAFETHHLVCIDFQQTNEHVDGSPEPTLQVRALTNGIGTLV